MVLSSEDLFDDIEIPSDDSDEEDIDASAKLKRHKKLLKEIGVETVKKRKSTRNEPSREVSEFEWSSGTGNKNKLELSDLVGTLESSKQPIAALKKKLRKMENTTKVLEKPLTKPETQRIERTVAYQDAATHLSKWNPTVQKNREAEQLSFPMNKYIPPPTSTTTLVTQFKPRNDLEREISAVLNGSQHLLERKDKELTEAEETALKVFDLEEALERRKELQKARALQSYYETKCRRTKKIKSKKYHRILKKEQQNALSKVDLETLSKENPELFQKELEKAEKMRAMERANLRHRNTSKWAKNMILKGNKSKQDQENVREQLRISRQLTEHKTAVLSEDEDGIEVAEDENKQKKLNLLENTNALENPWLLGSKGNVEAKNADKDKVTRYKKLNPIVTKESSRNRTDDEEDSDEGNVSSGDEWSFKDISNLKKKNKKTKQLNKKTACQSKGNAANGEVQIQSASDMESDQEYEGVDKLDVIKNVQKTTTAKEDKKQDSKKVVSDNLRFLKEDSGTIELDMQDESGDEDEEEIYDTEQRINIREAFANDDVIGDFVQEKNDLIEKSKPKPEEATLPGWGEWAGAGVTVSKNKRKNFTKNPGPALKRKDDGKSNVIINEVRNKKLAKHQVSILPFPYSSKAEFERSIRQPIGEQWNTPSVHNKLIEPRIQTLAGAVIDPLKPSKRMKKKLNKK